VNINRFSKLCLIMSQRLIHCTLIMLDIIQCLKFISYIRRIGFGLCSRLLVIRCHYNKIIVQTERVVNIQVNIEGLFCKY
jgi:hypothetical protein